MLITSEDLIRIIVILLVVFIVILIIKKAFKFACFLIALLCLYQVGFMFSQTDLNNHFPFDKYFKYDMLGSVTSIWENTDKEKLKDDISSGVDNIIDKTEDIIDGFKNNETIGNPDIPDIPDTPEDSNNP